MKTGHEKNQESLDWLFNSRRPIKSSNYKWQPRHLDKEDVKIYYDLIKNLTIVNPRDSTYELPVSAYSYLYKFCEAVGLESEKNDLQKWFKKTTSETINGNDDYFEVDTDIIDTIEFAMEDYLNDTVQSSRRPVKSARTIGDIAEEYQDTIYDLEDFFGVNSENGKFYLGRRLTDDDYMNGLDDICRRHNIRFEPLSTDEFTYHFIKNSRTIKSESNMIDAILDEMNKIIREECKGMEITDRTELFTGELYNVAKKRLTDRLIPFMV